MIKKSKFKLISGGILLFSAIIYLTAFFNNPSNILTNYKEPQISATVFSAHPLAVVGDLQRTSIYERMIGREQNDPERRKIISSIANQNPAVVVMLGDMIFDGSSENEWKDFDSLIIPIKKKNIPIYPVIGNHEYWGKNYIAMKNLGRQFPILSTTHWYAEIYDSLALIILDSNEPDLTMKGWVIEHNWFNKTIAELDTSKSIRGILVFDHHPPFTNSLVTGDEYNVQKNFLPAFYSSKKTLLFVSGHAHTYEHFLVHDKTFIVSGGGGGPRVKLKNGIGVHNDFFVGASPRPFNYLLIRKGKDGINIQVKGLNKGSSKFFTMEEFKINFEKRQVESF